MSKLGIHFCMASLVSLMGCRSAFQPPPEDFDVWKKPEISVSVQKVMAALLECGYPWPSTKQFDSNKYWGEAFEAEYVLADRCMESQGYVSEYSSYAQCTQGLTENFKQHKTQKQIQAIEYACDPETPAPKPSVEKRLNSPYCKTEWASKYPQCQLDFNPDTSSNNRHSEKVTIPSYSATDRITSQVQKDSNTQMNQLLQGTEKKK